MFVNIVNTQDGESGAGEVSGQSCDVETLGLEYEDIPERKDKIKQEYEWKSKTKNTGKIQTRTAIDCGGGG